MKVGILALQGAFVEHARRFARLGCETFEIRQRAHIPTSFDALVLPGGESTAQGLLLRELGLFEPLREAITGRIGGGANSNLARNGAENRATNRGGGAESCADFAGNAGGANDEMGGKIHANSNLSENFAQNGGGASADVVNFAGNAGGKNSVGFAGNAGANFVANAGGENRADFVGAGGENSVGFAGNAGVDLACGVIDEASAKTRANLNLRQNSANFVSAGADIAGVGVKIATKTAKTPPATPSGVRVLATCAGAILLAKRLENDPATHFATLDVVVRRNAYGRQLGSFHALGDFAGLGRVPMTFIRAPIFTAVGAGVRVLARVGGNVVAVSSANQLALSFHPELDENDAIFEYFLGMRGDFMADFDGGFAGDFDADFGEKTGKNHAKNQAQTACRPAQNPAQTPRENGANSNLPHAAAQNGENFAQNPAQTKKGAK